jgi:uncharacterized membrane protein
MEGAKYEVDTEIVFDARATIDPDNDRLTFYWCSNRTGALGYTARFTCVLPVGTHQITVYVNDAQGHNVSETVNISIVEDTPTLPDEVENGEVPGPAPTDSEREADRGILGIGKILWIDLFYLILLLVMLVIVLIIVIAIAKSRRTRKREEVERVKVDIKPKRLRAVTREELIERKHIAEEFAEVKLKVRERRRAEEAKKRVRREKPEIPEMPVEPKMEEEKAIVVDWEREENIEWEDE